MIKQKFADFDAFYQFYLSQHRNRTCRRLHLIGLILSLSVLVVLVVNGAWLYLPVVLLIGYGLAWLGHFGFERNQPATFRYPLLSLRGDFAMAGDILFGAIKF